MTTCSAPLALPGSLHLKLYDLHCVFKALEQLLQGFYLLLLAFCQTAFTLFDLHLLKDVLAVAKV